MHRLDWLRSGLQLARDFFEVAKCVCHTGAQRWDLHQVMVMHIARDGRPLYAVDSMPNVRAESRRGYFRELWKNNAHIKNLLLTDAPTGDEVIPDAEFMESMAAAGYEGDFVHTLMLPLLETQGLMGALAAGRKTAFGAELRGELQVAATYVSVRLAQLGVTVANELPPATALTPRQRESARLAVQGATNAEIAEQLAISPNTVKKHLRDTFERLGVVNRTELTAALSRDAFGAGEPGVYQRDGLWVSRGPF